MIGSAAALAISLALRFLAAPLVVDKFAGTGVARLSPPEAAAAAGAGAGAGTGAAGEEQGRRRERQLVCRFWRFCWGPVKCVSSNSVKFQAPLSPPVKLRSGLGPSGSTEILIWKFPIGNFLSPAHSQPCGTGEQDSASGIWTGQAA